MDCLCCRENNIHYRFWHHKGIKFLFGGLVSTSPDFDEMMKNSSGRIALESFTFILTCSLWTLALLKVDHEYNWAFAIAVVALQFLLYVLAYGSVLVNLCLTDPGYLAVHSDALLGGYEGELSHHGIDISQRPRSANCVYIRKGEKKVAIRQKFCYKCAVHRDPLVTHHCTCCNSCVDHIDHHCVFMGKCVGKRNHKNFTMMLFFLSLNMFIVSLQSLWLFVYLIIYGLVWNISDLMKLATLETEDPHLKTFLIIEIVCYGILIVVVLLCSIYIMVIALGMFGMLVFHIHLIFSKATTRAYIRGVEEYNKEDISCFQIFWSIISYFICCKCLKVKRAKSRLFDRESKLSNAYHTMKLFKKLKKFESEGVMFSKDCLKQKES